MDLLIERQAARSGLSAADALREIMADVFSVMESHGSHVRVFFEHHRELGPADRAAIAARRDRYAAMVEAEVERGVRDGQLRPVDARLATLALFGMCNWAYQWYRVDGPLGSRELADRFWEMLFDGLRRRD
jgi:hypothetical protein